MRVTLKRFKDTHKTSHKMALNNIVILVATLTTLTLLGNNGVHSQFLWSNSDQSNTSISSPIKFTIQDMTILVHESKSFDVVVK